MTKTAALVASAVLSLLAGSALAGQPGKAGTRANAPPAWSGGDMLYNQNNHYGYAIVSQNFTSGSQGTADNAAAADDFVVPKGETWKVTEVDVTGEYFYLSGPATSEVMTFYKNENGHPGTVLGQPQKLNCTETSGSFACAIKPVTLRGGPKGKRYWISFVANCDYKKCGGWGWVQNTITHRNPGQWENPGGGLGLGCTSWSATSTCNLQTGGANDFAFDLRGKTN